MKDVIESVLQLPSLDSKSCGESIATLLDVELMNSWGCMGTRHVLSVQQQMELKFLGDIRCFLP